MIKKKKKILGQKSAQLQRNTYKLSVFCKNTIIRMIAVPSVDNKCEFWMAQCVCVCVCPSQPVLDSGSVLLEL